MHKIVITWGLRWGSSSVCGPGSVSVADLEYRRGATVTVVTAAAAAQPPSQRAAGSASESDALVCESGAWSGANQRLGVGSLPYCSSRQFNERRLGLGPAAAAECYRDVRVMGLPSPSGATGRLPGRRSRLQPVILC